MNQIYFEMNDKERQLQHIGDALSYAICMFAEGLSGKAKKVTWTINSIHI